MVTFEIKGSSSQSKILIGEQLQNLTSYIPGSKAIIITDHNVRKLYGHLFPPFPVIEIGMGEQIKTLQTIGEITEKLIEYEADRSVFIIGIGGGLVCDVTGFVASIFMRGVRFGFVSTTLLSQVDASVGGKNGVNYEGYKNIIGVFNQPEFVICDLNLLNTLSVEDLTCGFAEIVKHTLIADYEMFTYLEKNYNKAILLDKEVIEKLVLNSVEIKAGVVNKDEKESGERKKLNFGHTFGHAIEKTTRRPHGEAVSLGMVVAAALSVKKGLIQQNEFERIINLLTKLKLPVNVPVDADMIIDAMKKDKKRKGSNISFILLESIGKALIEEISITELEEVTKKI